MSDTNDTESVLVEAFPEVMQGVTAWAYDKIPDTGTILVSRQRLRELLLLVARCRPLACGALFKIHGGDKGKHMADAYEADLAKANIIDLMNKTSDVWCEGKLIVSGLFIGEDGKPVTNACAEGKD